MTNEQQEKLKAMAAAEYHSRLAGDLAAGAIGSDRQQCQGAQQVAVPSLRERVRNQRVGAEQESYRLNHLHELEYLLDKHPEVARILELMEAVK